MSRPGTLVLVAHGTRRAPGRTVVGQVVAGVRRALPGVEVLLGHVDVQAPTLAAALRRAPGEAVVVPLLLSTGYHVEVDIAGAVDPVRHVVTPSLAGDPALVDVAADRLREAGGTGLDALVVAATGSSRPGARDEVGAFAAALGSALGLPAGIGWAAGDRPDVAAATRAAVRPGGRVGVATYMIGPGVFAARARRAGLDAGAVAVAAPLGADPRLVDLVVRRYRAAVR